MGRATVPHDANIPVEFDAEEDVKHHEEDVSGLRGGTPKTRHTPTGRRTPATSPKTSTMLPASCLPAREKQKIATPGHQVDEASLETLTAASDHRVLTAALGS